MWQTLPEKRCPCHAHAYVWCACVQVLCARVLALSAGVRCTHITTVHPCQPSGSMQRHCTHKHHCASFSAFWFYVEALHVHCASLRIPGVTLGRCCASAGCGYSLKVAVCPHIGNWCLRGTA